MVSSSFCVPSPFFICPCSVDERDHQRRRDRPVRQLIVNAEVEIANDATGIVYSAETNSSGMYLVPILPPGHYHVQVSKPGFKTIIKADVVLNVQSALALNFTLPVGATSESVTVGAASAPINTTDASVSTVIDRKFVENMPLNGRSLQSLISIAPGVVQTPIPYGSSSGNSGEFSVNGQRTESNYYTVDGVSANVGVGNLGTYSAGIAGLTPSQTALGTTQTLASIDALEEFRIQYLHVFRRVRANPRRTDLITNQIRYRLLPWFAL